MIQMADWRKATVAVGLTIIWLAGTSRIAPADNAVGLPDPGPDSIEPSGEPQPPFGLASEAHSPAGHIKELTVPDGTGDAALNSRFFKGMMIDTREILTSPLNWEEEWKTFAFVTGITSGFLVLDESIQHYAQRGRAHADSAKYKMGFEDQVSRFVEPLGDARYHALPLAGCYLYGHFKDDSRAKRAALYSAESLFIGNLITHTLKRSINRQRPPASSIRRNAMPSGHTMTAFTIATVFANEYDDNRFVAPVAYSLATLCGLSRIHDNRHWASDVFLGGAIGYFTARSVLKRHERTGRRESKHKNRFTIVPVVEDEAFGLGVSFSF
jgi:hypothetical protein